MIVALPVTSTITFAAAATTTTTQNNQNVPPSYNGSQSKGINQGGLTHESVKGSVGQGSILKVSESSFVQGVKITEAKTTNSPGVVAIKLAQVVQGTNNNNTKNNNNNKSATKKGEHTPDITLVALVDQMQANEKVADSTIVKGGWSNSKTIDMKITGIDFTKGAPMIRVLAIPLTSSTQSRQ